MTTESKSAKIRPFDKAVADWFKTDFISALNPRLDRLIVRLNAAATPSSTQAGAAAEEVRDLKCLFCPSTEMAIYWLPESEPNLCHVFCCKCNATGPWCESEKEAIGRHCSTTEEGAG